MRVTITIDEDVFNNTLLRVTYKEKDSEVILTNVKVFIEEFKQYHLELVLTAVTLLYIVYDENLITGEKLALCLYEKLSQLKEAKVIVDEASFHSQCQWTIIKNSLL